MAYKFAELVDRAVAEAPPPSAELLDALAVLLSVPGVPKAPRGVHPARSVTEVDRGWKRPDMVTVIDANLAYTTLFDGAQSKKGLNDPRFDMVGV